VFDRATTVGTRPAIIAELGAALFFIEHVQLNSLCDSISTRGYPVFPEPGRLMAGDTDQLFDCLAGLSATAPRK
jgi:hypothetical protein